MNIERKDKNRIALRWKNCRNEEEDVKKQLRSFTQSVANRTEDILRPTLENEEMERW